MPNKMLIDSSHPEETRVVVTRGNRIEEFDFESQDKKQLRGNIYLARVTRVEPSLQAAFVEYGGNRHGFLAFSEIHPDYYQIPVADRQAILQAEAEEVRAEDARAEEEEGKPSRGRGRRGRRSGRSGDETAAGSEETSSDETQAAAVEGVESISEEAGDHGGNGDHDEDEVDTVGAEDAIDEAHTRRKPMRRHYKIQEVIKRRQILLVQVVKEERGNKGAALTTYLSLAGRYSVLMPNTARGGGISRKITSLQDRKRLKDIVRELEVPQGMGVILRTAGANRTRAEVKRDYEYLMRMWEKVRGLTLESTAPSLVYEEGSLIKRSIRDLYNKDIDEIAVAGEDGYREAKDFMRMLMPSHAKVVQPYRDTIPIFARNGIEGQLDRMVQPQVTLKSGGYIIINQTEALVAIDVNSGRSTKEHSIEDTALQTNLEAAEEVARQLRLRDLAGLIVIDFIDMEENRNNRSVEKKLKECLKNDRARIQVGRISHFGLLEMSRQRIRASVLDSTMQPCPHCGGTGHIRSESSVALLVLRAIEEYLLKDSRNDITVQTPPSTALYVLNNKRTNLVALEQRFGVRITIEADAEVGSQHYTIVKGAPAEKPANFEHVAIDSPFTDVDDAAEAAADEAAAAAAEAALGDDEQPATATATAPGADEGNRDRKKRRRRRRRGGRDRQPEDSAYVETAASDLGGGAQEFDAEAEEGDREAREAIEDGDDQGERKKRRRGKRGGKRNRRGDEQAGEDTADGESAGEPEAADALASSQADASAEAPAESGMPEAAPSEATASQTETDTVEAAEEEKPAKRKRAPRRPRKTAAAEAAQAEISDAAPESEPAAPVEAAAAPADEPETAVAEAAEPAEPASPPARRRAPRAEPAAPAEPQVSSSGESDEGKPRRTGWWQRRGFF